MSYQYQSTTQSAHGHARDPQRRALGDMDPEMASVLDHYASQGPAACATALESFPENERARCWAYLQRAHGNAFVAEATDGRSMGTPTADPGIVVQLFESAKKDARAAGDWLRRSYPEPFWIVYATALHEHATTYGKMPGLKGEALVHRVMGREGPAAACDKMYLDDLMRRAGAVSSWEESEEDTFGSLGAREEAPKAESAAAPAQTAIDPAQQAELEAEVSQLMTMMKTMSAGNAADYQQVSAAAMHLHRWRAQFPTAGDDASFTLYTGFNPHMALLRAESTSRAWIKRAHETGQY